MDQRNRCADKTVQKIDHVFVDNCMQSDIRCIFLVLVTQRFALAKLTKGYRK